MYQSVLPVNIQFGLPRCSNFIVGYYLLNNVFRMANGIGTSPIKGQANQRGFKISKLNDCFFFNLSFENTLFNIHLKFFYCITR